MPRGRIRACHVARVRQVEARVTLWFGSTAAEGYWVGLVVGPRFTGLGRKYMGCKPVRLDRGFGLGSIQLNRGF